MVDSSKRLLWGRLAVLVSILYLITIGGYFMWFYKPVELITTNVDMPVIASVNETFKDIHRDRIMFVFIFSLLACVGISAIILAVYDEIILYTKPVIEVNARCKLKEGKTNINVSPRGGTTVFNTYMLTFELENGTEMSFPVKDKHYMTILEGNKGIMKYKEGRVNRYIGFDLKKVE